MRNVRFSAISLFVLLAIPNVTSSNQQNDIPERDEGHWGLVRTGFLSAGKYLALRPDVQAVYMAGMIDGMFLAPMFEAPDDDKYLIRIQVCLNDGRMTNTQIAAIVTKYVKKRPDQWKVAANAVAYQALREACPVI